MRAILTAAEMRAAEEAAVAAGSGFDVLMERAGAAVAELARRMAAGREVLILCGPGNNGGDGYVAARLLAESGVAVRVAAFGELGTEIASAARARWTGAVEGIAEARPAPLLVDCLFGTGLTRGLPEELAGDVARLAAGAERRLAVDLPSGVAADDGALLSDVPRFDATLALGALKPAHRLRPAAEVCGAVLVADIGIVAEGRLHEIARPVLAAPGPEDHKYTRGMVAIVGGAMHGAARLAAEAAAHSGAGYVLLAELEGGQGAGSAAVVRRGYAGGALLSVLGQYNVGAVVVGPGLTGADEERAEAALMSGRPLVLDARAIELARPNRAQGAILTPHEGEFVRNFGELPGSRIDRARAAAALSGAVVVLKGSDTVVAAPDGRAAISPPASPWLSTAGTGDVLAGVCGAMLARGLAPFEAACAAQWLHAAAARAAGPAFVADDLIDHLPVLVASCR